MPVYPIYLDHAAATPLDPEVLDAMQPYLTADFYNPSAQYLAAKKVRDVLERARAQVAGVLGAKPAEIIFTAGGTEANNLAIRGLMDQFPEGNIVISAIEHDSVIEPAQRSSTRVIPVGTDGRIDLMTLERAIDDRTVLVSVMYANNEIGTVEPLKEIAEIIKQKRQARMTAGATGRPHLPRPLYFHTDACQGANYLPLQVARLGVDLMTLNGGKLYGPKQAGALYIKSGVYLQPLIAGGGQERDLRSGTENVAGSIGLAAALVKTQAMRQNEVRRLQAIQQAAFDLIEAKLPHAVINGSRKHRLPNNVNLTIPGTDAERLVMELDEAGVQAATGSACSAAKTGPSHVLKALGLSDTNARSTLRLTMGRQTSLEQIDQTIAVLARLVA